MRQEMISDSWYSIIYTMTVGDVRQMLCKQKQTLLLYTATNGERNTRFLDLSFTANEVRTFQKYQLCLFQLNRGQDLWRMLKIYV